MSHARLSPSAAARWTTCPGSVSATKDLPNPSGEAAAEGTAAHELLEDCLLKEAHPETFRGNVYNKEHTQPNGKVGFAADDDMINAVEVAYDYIVGLVETTGGTLYPERKVPCGEFFQRDDCSGTADITIVHKPYITIADYKHGRGIVVEVEDNLQLILYALGVLAEVPVEERKLYKAVKIVVIQPRASHREGPIREITYDMESLYAWAQWFGEKAAATDDPEAELVPSNKGCKFCLLKKHGCPALVKETKEVLMVETIAKIPDRILKDVDSLTKAEEQIILDRGPLVIEFIKAVLDQKQTDAIKGEHIDNFKLVRGKPGNRKITMEDAEFIKFMQTSFGLKKSELLGAPKIVSIDKLIRLAKKSKKTNEKKMTKLMDTITRPDGKLTLVPESDSRDSAGRTAVLDAFKAVPKVTDK